ncbi:TPA: hypothetical protein ACXJSN_004248 [Pseudomonas aeruginosa]
MTGMTPVATLKPAALPAGYAGIHGGIVELLDAARRAGGGEQLMARLFADLTARFGCGFSPDNLESGRRFFCASSQPQTPQTLSRK